MRIGLVVVVCGLLGLVGCSGGSSGGSGKTQTQSPTANVGGPYAGTAGTVVSFSAAGSADPQGQALTYSWNFGDLAMGTGANPTHTYAIAGTYTVTLTVTDTSGLTGTSLSKATIAAAVLPDAALTGIVTSGPQAVVGAHVYLLAANTTGYGGAGIAASSSNASVSVLSAAATGASDALGAYATTGPAGGFSLTGDYTCVSGQQLYLYTVGGDLGSGPNPAIGMMAALGSCPSVGGPATYAVVNEVSTVATAYALAGFATDATHVGSSGTALALTGIKNAFANAGNLETLSTGAALATTPAGNGTVPLTEINTLGNILAACVNVSSQCSTLLSTATADGTATGSVPTDTATAAINMAHHPGANVAALYGLAEVNPSSAPGLAVQPNDFTVALNFTGGGVFGPKGIAIDGSGDAWVANALSSVSEFSSVGAPISPSTGYTGGGLASPYLIAVDPFGNVWTTNFSGPDVTELSSSGVAISPSPTGYKGGVSAPASLAIDGFGNVWVGQSGGETLTEFSNSGSLITPRGITGGLITVAIDSSENIWATSDYQGNPCVELNNAGTVIASTPGPAGLGCDLLAVDAQGDLWSIGGGIVSKFSVSNGSMAWSPVTTGGGLRYESGVSIDGSGQVWVVNGYGGPNGIYPNPGENGTLSEFSNGGAVLSPSGGFWFSSLKYPLGLAVDGSGNVWISNTSGSSVVEFIGAATPVVTPLSVGVKNNMLGTRP